MSSIFKDMLGSDETIFRDAVALDYDYVPKIVPFRDQQQQAIVHQAGQASMPDEAASSRFREVAACHT